MIYIVKTCLILLILVRLGIFEPAVYFQFR